MSRLCGRDERGSPQPQRGLEAGGGRATLGAPENTLADTTLGLGLQTDSP